MLTESRRLLREKPDPLAITRSVDHVQQSRVLSPLASVSVKIDFQSIRNWSCVLRLDCTLEVAFAHFRNKQLFYFLITSGVYDLTHQFHFFLFAGVRTRSVCGCILLKKFWSLQFPWLHEQTTTNERHCQCQVRRWKSIKFWVMLVPGLTDLSSRHHYCRTTRSTWFRRRRTERDALLLKGYSSRNKLFLSL